MPSSRGSSYSGDRTGVCLHLLHWQVDSLPTESPGKPSKEGQNSPSLLHLWVTLGLSGHTDLCVTGTVVSEYTTKCLRVCVLCSQLEEPN